MGAEKAPYGGKRACQVDTNRHLVVLSADAMADADLEYAKTLPNFKRLLEGGARVEHVRSIYPSVTYPAHVTMSTGCFPEKTGVWANEKLQPGALHPEWLWFHDVVRCPDIFDAAKAAGLTTAAVFWPVTGNHKSIDWLIDEYWPQGEDDTKEACFLRSGTTPELYDEALRPFIGPVTIRKHPMTDDLVCKAGAEIIRRHKPNLIMLHPANIDGARHAWGLFNGHVDEAVRETDEWLGLLMDAARDAGIYENTDFVVLSDHGQMDIVRVMCLNVKLREAGLIRVAEDGSFLDWDAYVKSCGMSAHVYVKNKADEPRVKALLEELVAEEVYGVSALLTADEAREKYGLAGDFSFVLETDGFTSFGDDWHRPLARSYDRTDYRHGRATHGYMPEKGPQPIFLAAGPRVRKGAVLERCELVDDAPTLAAMLGLRLPEAQGRVLNELLR